MIMNFQRLIRSIRSHPDIWLAALAVVLVGGRLLWVHAGRPAHRREITAAFGSVSLFNDFPKMNQDGSRFIYVATAPRGFGLFLCDTALGRKQMICEQTNGLGVFADGCYLRSWPWAPDDHAFVYSTQDRLFIYPANESQAVTPESMAAHEPTEVIWVAPQELAWLEGETLCYAQKSAGGDWAVQRLPHQGTLSNLRAIGDHAVAWLQDGYICRINLAAAAAATNNPFRPPHTPASETPLMTNLTLRLDASTLQQADQTPVSYLADLSRNGNSATVNQYPPVFNAPDSPGGLNGRGTIHFKSGGSSINATGLKTAGSPGVKGAEPRTVFVVMRRTPDGLWMLINLGETGQKGGYFGINDQFNFTYLPAGWGEADNMAPPAAPNWRILEVVYDGVHQLGYVNGLLTTATAYPYDTADKPVEIGLRTGGNPAGSDGDFAELLVYNRALDTTERGRVEEYLNEKWFGGRLLTAGNPLVWHALDTGAAGGFDYSPETGRLLISRTGAGQDFLWQMDAQSEALAGAALVTQGRSLQSAQWAGPRDLVYNSHEPGHTGLVFTDLSGAENRRILEHAGIGWFKLSPDEKKVLFWGNASNEPAAGIWQYDLETEALRSVAPASDYLSPYATNLPPTYRSVKLPSGRSVTCTVYLPANFNPHKKYPLVLGNTQFGVAINGGHGRLWVPNIATCGAYVVIINREEWWTGIEQWEENVRGVAQALVKEPNIDPQRVYLFAASAETKYLSECLTRTPSLWRGGIFLNPTALPDFTTSPPHQIRPKILISAGGNEQEKQRLQDFQAKALKSGVLVEYVIHPGENHHLIGNAAQLERNHAMMHFIFEE